MLSQQSKNNPGVHKTTRRTSKPEKPPTLTLFCNGSVQKELRLDNPRVLIGRLEDNDLSIPSNYVSRRHILLVRQGGQTILIDLNSTNGTFVNAKRVYSHVQVLADGDVITVDTHQQFMQYSIQYKDPTRPAGERSTDVQSANKVVEEALADIGELLPSDDTNQVPALKESLPTEMGFLDDR